MLVLYKTSSFCKQPYMMLVIHMSAEEIDNEIRALTEQRDDLLRDERILAAGEAEIREREELLKTPFMVELREIFIRGCRKSNAKLKDRLLDHIDQSCEERMRSFYGELREIVAPEEPTIRESQIEEYINKILRGKNASTGVV